MKQTMKRLIALILALATIFSLATAAAATEATTDEEGKVTADTGEVTASGTTSAGNLIAETIQEATEAQEETQSEACYISDLSITGTTATVEFQTDTDADLVVAIYAEDDLTQMVASGTTSVTSSEITAEVTIDTTEMPTYFVAAAYLADAESHQPLCAQKTTNLYTQEMQEFLSKTVDDFDADRVLNLDENKDTNFGVYEDDTVVVEAEGAANQLTDNGDGTYTITNADSTFTSLAVGDIFSYDDGSGDVLIVKVKAITVDGTTVTVTEDETLELDEVFAYLRVESVEGEGTATLDNSDLPEGVEYINTDESGVSATATEISYSGQIINASYDFNYNGDDDKGNDEDQYFKVTGDFSARVDLNIGASLKLYLAGSHTEFSAKLDFSAGFTVELTGSVRGRLPVGCIKFIPIPAVIMTFEPSVVLEIGAKASGTIELKGTMSWLQDSQTGKGIQYLPTLSSDINLSAEVTVTVFFGLKFEPEIEVINKKVAKASLSGELGAEAELKFYDKAEVKWDSNGLTIGDDDELHDCSSCLYGPISLKASAKGSITFLSHWTFSCNFITLKWKWCDFYKSFTYDDWGFTTCPHKSYKCSVTVVDENGDPVPDLTVLGTQWEDGNAFYGASKDSDSSSGSSSSGGSITTEVPNSGSAGMPLTADPVTDDNGKLTLYLKNGTYTLSVASGNLVAKQKITVHGGSKSTQLTLRDKYADSVASGTCGTDLT